MAKLFGTDGIRGIANKDPLVPEKVVCIGKAIGISLRNGKARHNKVLIGKDTRLSGYLIETAICSGLCSVGVDPYLVGPLPTPGIAFLTINMRAVYGVVISASHNPYYDNGIKLFDAQGFKLSDEKEADIERLVLNPPLDYDVSHGAIGKAFRIDDAVGRYVVHLKYAFPRHLDLEGIRVVIDCAHGSAYKVAPWVFEELGAEVIVMNDQPDGVNINEGCGAMHPKAMAEKVLETGAHIGLALDGDADRAILADEKGEILHGDQIMAMLAASWAKEGRLKHNLVVSTVMSTLALDRFLSDRGIGLVRAQVGDRYVVETMRREGANIGGEPSGHFVFFDHANSGDGILTALMVLELMLKVGRPLSELKRIHEPLPQLLLNIETNGDTTELLKKWAGSPDISRLQESLGPQGRLFVRSSGTQPLIRILLEGKNPDVLETVGQEVMERLHRLNGRIKATSRGEGCDALGD
jgi:phosphoglucosamine mutase